MIWALPQASSAIAQRRLSIQKGRDSMARVLGTSKNPTRKAHMFEYGQPFPPNFEMQIILQNHQPDNRRPTRQLHRGKSYRVNLEDLLIDGELDTSMAKWCQHRRDEGTTLFLWSEKGKYHARETARELGVESLFSW